mmetsp:Transcript_74947/g.132827  ORF Transcript_74947/g.132827 Transcript_74947/m.132827 type:complete len:88 (-) Transcript_74947:79-342(-)
MQAAAKAEEEEDTEAEKLAVKAEEEAAALEVDEAASKVIEQSDPRMRETPAQRILRQIEEAQPGSNKNVDSCACVVEVDTPSCCRQH